MKTVMACYMGSESMGVLFFTLSSSFSTRPLLIGMVGSTLNGIHLSAQCFLTNCTVLSVRFS